MKKRIIAVFIAICCIGLFTGINASANNGFWYNYLGNTISFYNSEEDDSIEIEISNKYITNQGNTLNISYMYTDIEYYINSMNWNSEFLFLEMYLYLNPNVSLVGNEITLINNNGLELNTYLYFGNDTQYNVNFRTDLKINTSTFPSSQSELFRGIEIQDAFIVENYINYSGIQEITFIPSTTISTLSEELKNARIEIERLMNELLKKENDLLILQENYNVLLNNYNILEHNFEEYLQGSIGLPQLILTYVDIPIKTISGFLGFEVFGMNLFEAFSGIITMLVILFVIKKLWK